LLNNLEGGHFVSNFLKEEQNIKLPVDNTLIFFLTIIYFNFREKIDQEKVK
jgi:hypothetical protein